MTQGREVLHNLFAVLLERKAVVILHRGPVVETRHEADPGPTRCGAGAATAGWEAWEITDCGRFTVDLTDLHVPISDWACGRHVDAETLEAVRQGTKLEATLEGEELVITLVRKEG